MYKTFNLNYTLHKTLDNHKVPEIELNLYLRLNYKIPDCFSSQT